MCDMTQILMSVVKIQMAVGRSALIQLDHTHVAATMAIGLPLMDTHAMVHYLSILTCYFMLNNTKYRHQ